MLKQKWHNTSNLNNRKECSKYSYTKSYSLSSSSASKINLDESSTLLKRIRNFFRPPLTSDNVNLTCVTQTGVSNSGSSSASSSPLVVFSRNNPNSAGSSSSTESTCRQTNTEPQVQTTSNAVSETTIQSPSSNINAFTYYSTTFTNSIKSKLNYLKHNLYVYKGGLNLNLSRCSELMLNSLINLVFLFICLRFI